MLVVIQDITPVPKPRQTRSDKWRKRPCVLRYRAFADELRAKAGPVPESPLEVDIMAHFPMPKSWSKAKRARMLGKPHRQRPDWDNVGKAICDALWPGADEIIADGGCKKRWGLTGSIAITILTDSDFPPAS